MHRNARIASVAIAAAAALTLTACGGSGGSGVAADKTQTLTVWAMGTEGEKLGTSPRSTRRPTNITVKVTPIGWDVATRSWCPPPRRASSRRHADGRELHGRVRRHGRPGAGRHQGLLDEKDYFPAGWDQGTVDGKTYGVPWYVDTRVLFYRTDLAKKAGIEKAPATMAELQQAATAYQKKAGTEWGLSIQPKNLDTVQSFYQFLYSAGGEIVSRTARPSSTDPTAVKALENYGSYFKKGLSESPSPPATA